MIHLYQNNGYNIVLDVNSGAVHVVDKAAYDVIGALEEQNELHTAETLKTPETFEFLRSKLGSTYAEEDIRDILEAVATITQEGRLFTRDVYEDYIDEVKQRKTVVKALCLHIAHDCNLACRYCFAEEGEYHGRRALMSYEVGKKALDFLIANSGKRRNLEVDFFGGDKQETMRLYEATLSDADDCGLMVIFHGCTLPRGWERMYPNYVGSEAVLASENLIFQQHFCDEEAFNACLHPFIRNSVGCMEFGGCFLNKRLNRTNDGGNIRRTTDAFQLATTVLFQNPIQNFALAPNNLTDASQICLEFLKQVPVTWDETVFIDGYPGKYCILARRHGDKWYVAGVNAQKEPLKLKIQLPMFAKGNRVTLYNDDLKRNVYTREVTLSKNKELPLTILSGGGIVIVK